MIDKVYIKKLTIENELSAPEARAERLRRLRNLANLSRIEICSPDYININTYKGWELARFGGLPVDGAEKIVKKIAKHGVTCSTEWLLYGKSPPPTLEIEPEILINNNEVEKYEVLAIKHEFNCYKNNTNNAILFEITDDGLLPFYKIGDFLAGSKKFDDEIKINTNQICIVETTDGKKYARYIKESSLTGLYNLICTNYSTCMDEILIHDVKLLYSAPISRHYVVHK